MQIDCPHGWKHRAKLGNITLESTEVTIAGGVCDSCDLCGIKDCEYYDTSRQATRRFWRALCHEHTLEGFLESLDEKARIEQPMNTPWWIAEPAPERPDEIKIMRRDNELLMIIDHHRYRLCAFTDPISADHLGGVVWVYRDQHAFHVDRIDLYNREQRDEFIRVSADELGVSPARIAEEVNHLCRYLEQHRDAMLQRALDEKNRSISDTADPH